MYLLPVTLFLTLVCSNYASNIEFDGWLNIKLQHSFGSDGVFTDRGNISIQSLRSGGSILDQNPLTPTDIKALQALSKTDDFYVLKSITQTSDGTESSFLSSVKAESLIGNDLNDCITVWVLNNGAVIAVGVTPSNTQTLQFQQSNTDKFRTEVFVKHIDQAPVPDTAGFVQKLEREREAREKGEFKDNRSFFVKYWMYIVPLAIFVLLTSATGPEQGAAR